MKLKQLISSKILRLALLLAMVSVWGMGCASTGNETDNISSKPWNSPEGYQNGAIPSNMFH